MFRLVLRSGCGALLSTLVLWFLSGRLRTFVCLIGGVGEQSAVAEYQGCTMRQGRLGQDGLVPAGHRNQTSQSRAGGSLIAEKKHKKIKNKGVFFFLNQKVQTIIKIH